MAGISGRLSDMAGKETRREAQRNELSRQLDELQAAHDAEFRRRSELERALREAAALFKQELYEKQAELDAAYKDARALRHQVALQQQAIASSPRLRTLDLEGASAYQVTTVDADSIIISQHPQLQPGGGGGKSSGGGGNGVGNGRGHYDSQVLVMPAGAGGGRPASPAVTSAAELEAELSALRQARAEYQRSITASQSRLDPFYSRGHSERRSGAVGLASSESSPAFNRGGAAGAGGLAQSPSAAQRASAYSASPSAAQYIHRLLGDDGPDGRQRGDTPGGDAAGVSFEAWRERLSSRLSTALRKLEPSLGPGR